jgi:asparagine synthase (glutamine-hydrolysing)
MCGIIALYGNNTKDIKDSVVERMLSCIAKRGPDEKNFTRLENVILGQTRLSIVDIVGGHQPMKDNARDFTVVFNGEIYGYRDTRIALEKKGHVFTTNSDTEVILKAYAEYGLNCVDHLDGMFAFALWDGEKKELFVARDRFGKKPFYYTWHNNLFIAASEIKSIVATGMIKGSIDSAAIDDFLRLLYIPPYRTIYSNIQTLPPAHAGIIKDGKIKTWGYWNLEKKEITISYDEAKKEIKRLFDNAVKKRMVADVEIGSLLSGGIDSTIVTAYAQKYSTYPIKTFSVGYEGKSNELPFALEASQKIGTKHSTLETHKVSLNEIKTVIAYFDEPHADSSDFPQHLVSQLAATKVKVALTGDGADELFMGYGWYQKYWHTPLWKRLFSNPFASYKKITEVFSLSERKSLLKKAPTNSHPFESTAIAHTNSSFEKINAFDLRIYLPGQLLTKIDRTSMMHSLEIRSPFLDTALAEFVYNLPQEFKLSKTENKIILKDILAETFPADFVYRKKQGFGAPLKEWIANESLQKELSRIANDKNHVMYRYLSQDAVKRVFDGSASYNKSSVQKVWSLLTLALWFELHANDYE